ncbi:MAG TPA: ThiF family adenylyltransferase, partial [Planctomycetota bacterium]|nr:ThiF family adenylyltransferase [Planctomycetota bacterium]
TRALARVERARVLVIGVGAVGNEVAKNLALVGVRRLTLVDPDTVELSNLNRCIFFREGDVGRRKVHVARRALRAAAPATEVVAIARPIQQAPEEVWDADVVALCVDDELARYYVNARLLGMRRPIPVVNGAMGRTWAEATVLVPGQTACLVCLWSQEYQRAVLGEEVRRKCDAFFQGARVKFPTISVLTSLVGAVSSTEVVKLLANSPEELPPAVGKRLRYDVRRHELVVQEIVPNPQCVDAMCRRRRGV